MLHASPNGRARRFADSARDTALGAPTPLSPPGLAGPAPTPPRGQPTPMPNGPDQRTSRNRRPRRRSQSTNRLPVTEQDEVAELEAARERNDLDISDLREMSVKELQQVGKRLDIEGGSRRDELVDQILQAQTERSGLEYAFGILDVV